MKRFLLAAVLSVGALALSREPASAGYFHHCCNKCCTFCCRPYNAFSPICCGTLFCDGCCPQFGCQMHNPPAGPGPYGDAGCPGGVCAAGGVCPDGGFPDGACVDGSCGGGVPWSGPASLPAASGTDGQAPATTGPATGPATGGQLPMPGTTPFQAPTPQPLPNGTGIQSSYPLTYSLPVQPSTYPVSYPHGYQPAYPPTPMGYPPLNLPNTYPH